MQGGELGWQATERLRCAFGTPEADLQPRHGLGARRPRPRAVLRSSAALQKARERRGQSRIGPDGAGAPGKNLCEPDGQMIRATGTRAGGPSPTGGPPLAASRRSGRRPQQGTRRRR